MLQDYKALERRRTRWAVAFSLVAHAAFLAVGGWPSMGAPGTAPGNEPPLVVNLQPDEPETPREVVASAGPPATSPVQDTNLISDRDSNAQDPQDEVEGKEKAPLASRDSDHLEVGGAPVAVPAPKPAAPEPPVPPAPKAEEKKPEAPKAPEKKVDAPKPKAEPKPVPEKPKPAAPPAGAMAVAKAETAGPAAKESGEAAKPSEEKTGAAEKEAERTEVARREAGVPAPPTAMAKPGTFRGSVEGGIKGKGVLGLEARKDEIAPYLLEVRKKVERHWRAAVALKFKGSTPTKAEVECEIAPDGRLVRAEIVEAGKVIGFAPICKESIEKAAPYPKFPFEVPAMYRNQNIEIHWTFEFM